MSTKAKKNKIKCLYTSDDESLAHFYSYLHDIKNFIWNIHLMKMDGKEYPMNDVNDALVEK